MRPHEHLSMYNILARTPMVEPFYSQVRLALERLETDPSSATAEIVHGYISALAIKGKLTDDWRVTSSNGFMIIAHVDFLKIQDEFSELEARPDDDLGDSTPEWSSIYALESFKKYLSRMRQYREEHISLFNRALEQFSDNDLEEIFLTTSIIPHYLTVPETITLVAIPTWIDNSYLWHEEIGVQPRYIEAIPPWAKIFDIGLVFASRTARMGSNVSHDYFSYAAHQVFSKQVSNMEDQLVLTAQHEGSHGIFDTFLLLRLGIDYNNLIGEGIAGSLGDDGRGRRHTKITLADLISDPIPDNDEHRSERAYIAGTKFWDSVVEVLRRRGLDKESAWIKIMANAIHASITLTSRVEFCTASKNDTVRNYLYALLDQLDITVNELNEIYDEFNI